MIFFEGIMMIVLAGAAARPLRDGVAKALGMERKSALQKEAVQLEGCN
jgi:hypothetical protein